MDYSVYIIQDRGKENVDIIKKLAGDTSIRDHFRNAAQNLVNNIAGENVMDPYATTDILGPNGVAIRGEMIKSVSIKSELAKKDMFVNGTIRVDKFALTTITVKGNLFAPSLFEMASESVKNKDMARVAAWAALPPVPAPTVDNNNEYKGDVSALEGKAKDAFKLAPFVQNDYGNNYKNFYYRRVLVTVYSDTDTQFRAILHDKVFVSSYEEVYDDKDGNGHFTLVMQCIGASAFDVFIAGPTYDMKSIISVTDQISSSAQKVTKAVSKGAKTVDHVAGTDISKGVSNVTNKIDSGFETADSFRGDGDINLDNLDEQINKQSETWHPTEKDAVIKKANEYQSEYDSLTPEQKDALKNIPGFDEMSQDDKMDYIDRIKSSKDKGIQDTIEGIKSSKTKGIQDTIEKAAAYKKAYDELTTEQKATLANIPGFNTMSIADKLAYITKLTEKK